MAGLLSARIPPRVVVLAPRVRRRDAAARSARAGRSIVFPDRLGCCSAVRHRSWVAGRAAHERAAGPGARPGGGLALRAPCDAVVSVILGAVAVNGHPAG